MILQDKQTGALVEVVDTEELINPMQNKIKGRIQDGQEEQPPEDIGKDTLVFPSGEELPRCWRDADYRSA